MDIIDFVNVALSRGRTTRYDPALNTDSFQGLYVLGMLIFFAVAIYIGYCFFKNWDFKNGKFIPLVPGRPQGKAAYLLMKDNKLLFLGEVFKALTGVWGLSGFSIVFLLNAMNEQNVDFFPPFYAIGLLGLAICYAFEEMVRAILLLYTRFSWRNKSYVNYHNKKVKYKSKSALIVPFMLSLCFIIFQFFLIFYLVGIIYKIITAEEDTTNKEMPEKGTGGSITTPVSGERTIFQEYNPKDILQDVPNGPVLGDECICNLDSAVFIYKSPFIYHACEMDSQTLFVQFYCNVDSLNNATLKDIEIHPSWCEKDSEKIILSHVTQILTSDNNVITTERDLINEITEDSQKLILKFACSIVVSQTVFNRIPPSSNNYCYSYSTDTLRNISFMFGIYKPVIDTTIHANAVQYFFEMIDKRSTDAKEGWVSVHNMRRILAHDVIPEAEIINHYGQPLFVTKCDSAILKDYRYYYDGSMIPDTILVYSTQYENQLYFFMKDKKILGFAEAYREW